MGNRVSIAREEQEEAEFQALVDRVTYAQQYSHGHDDIESGSRPHADGNLAGEATTPQTPHLAASLYHGGRDSPRSSIRIINPTGYTSPVAPNTPPHAVSAAEQSPTTTPSQTWLQSLSTVLESLSQQSTLVDRPPIVVLLPSQPSRPSPTAVAVPPEPRTSSRQARSRGSSRPPIIVHTGSSRAASPETALPTRRPRSSPPSLPQSTRRLDGPHPPFAKPAYRVVVEVPKAKRAEIILPRRESSRLSVRDPRLLSRSPPPERGRTRSRRGSPIRVPRSPSRSRSRSRNPPDLYYPSQPVTKPPYQYGFPNRKWDRFRSHRSGQMQEPYTSSGMPGYFPPEQGGWTMNAYPNMALATGLAGGVMLRNSSWRPNWPEFPLKVFRGSDSEALIMQPGWDDAALLRELRKTYDRLRTWRKWLSPRNVSGINRVWADHSVIFPRRIGPASVGPTQKKRLRYLLNNPGYMHGRYHFMQALTYRPDQGIEFVETFQLQRIAVAILLPVVLSTVFGVLWAVLTGDVSSAFTVAGYMTSAYSVCLVIVGVINLVEY